MAGTPVDKSSSKRLCICSIAGSRRLKCRAGESESFGKLEETFCKPTINA